MFVQNKILELYNSNPKIKVKALYQIKKENYKYFNLQKLIRVLSRGIKNGVNFKHDDNLFYVYRNEKPTYSFRLNIPLKDHYILIQKYGDYTDFQEIKKCYISIKN